MGRDRPKWHILLQQLSGPSWMCHSGRNGCWTGVSFNRKEAISSISAQIHHMPERYERGLVGWHCAKVKGHAELKIEQPRVKTLSYDFPKLHHTNTNSFRANVHLHQIKKNGLGHRKVTWRHTKVKVWEIEGAPKVLPCSKYGAIPTIICGVTAFWKRWSTPFFIDRPPCWKCQSNWTSFRTSPSPWCKKADQRMSVRFGSYRVNVTSCNLCARAKVPGHRELKLELNPSLVKLVEAS